MEQTDQQKQSAKLLSRILGCNPKSLPTLPSTALEISKLTKSETTSADDLVWVIKHDPTLAARLLQMANSPVFWTGEPVTEISRAVVLLGFDEIANLAMAINIFSAAGGDRPLRRRMQRVKLWQHSVVVGLLCEILARDVLEWGTGHYTYGLIHDIGKVALDAHRPDDVTQVLNRIEKRGASWLEAENEVMLVDHAFVGRALMDYWDLPRQMVAAAGGHHQPWEWEENKDLAGLVYVADTIAKLLGHQSFDQEKQVDASEWMSGPGSEFMGQRGWTMEQFASRDTKEKLLEALESADSLHI